MFVAGAFETPLGRAAIDADLAGALVAADPEALHADARPHRDEHSLEMQLPFVQRLLPDARIVPVLMGDQSRETSTRWRRRSGARSRAADALLVASSDLSHYLPAAQANAADAHVVADVADFAAERLMTRLEHGSNVACGGGPMVAVMKAARALGADDRDGPALRGQRRRGRARQEPRRRLSRGRAVHGGAMSAPLTDHGRSVLLAIARRAIAVPPRGRPVRAGSAGRAGAAAAARRVRDAEDAGRRAARLHRPPVAGGAARADGRARSRSRPATEDPRFGTVTRDELDALGLEVSVLSAYEPIAPDAVEIGRHGLMIRCQGKSGLLLPQVAPEHGLDREAFLAAVCRKAGLPKDAWRDPACALFGFTADVFGEDG